MNNLKIFIVEDDPWYADILEYHLALNPEYEIEKFHSGKECLKNLYKNPSVITLDYNMPDLSGKEMLKKIKESNPEIPVIIISGQEDITTALELLKVGAYDYIVKDDNTNDRLWNVINNLRENSKLKEENKQLKQEVAKKYEFSNIIIGKSREIEKVFNLMNRAAGSSITVSITGETGTGKELVAKAIHYNSERKKNALVNVNVSAIPKDLIESELFGHEKGAFTGAMNRRIGKFEEAHKGTIFLDEIAELDISLQSKLLRVLQEREITRIGSNKPVKIDVRVIIATHKNLQEEVKKKNFRQDLYFRLYGLPIAMPPLRDRGDDILLLAKHFADEFCRENTREKVSFAPDARKKLLKYSYPGNVRELKAVIELAIIMTDSDTLTASDINFDSDGSDIDFISEETTLENYNIRIVKHFLEKYDQNAILVAKKLGVAKTTIYRMIKKYELKHK